MTTYIVEYDYYNPYESSYALVNGDAEQLTPFKYEYIRKLEGEYFSAKKANTYIIIDASGKELETLLEKPTGYVQGINNDGSATKVALEEKLGSIEGIQNEGSFSDIFHQMYAYDESRIFWVKKEGKYGYLNQGLEEVIPFIYDDATAFYFNRAFVEKEGAWFLIDEKGNEISALEKGCSHRWYGRENYIGQLYAHGMLLVEKDGLIGVINRDGKTIVPPSDSLSARVKENILLINRGTVLSMEGDIISENEYDFVTLETYKDDHYYRVEKNDLMGLLDKDFNEVIPLEYNDLKYLNDIGVMAAKRGDMFGVINIKGEVILPFENESMADDRYGERHQYFLRYQKNGKVGFINLESRKVYDIDDFHDFSSGGWSSGSPSGFLNVEFGKFGYGKIGIDKNEVWYEGDVPIPDAKLHGVAIENLKAIIEKGGKLDAKIVRKLFKSVYYWASCWLEDLSPLINESNIFVIEELLTIAVKKAYGKQVLAGGIRFFDIGLALVQTYNPAIYTDFSNQLLEAAKKADKKKMVLEAIENNVQTDQVDGLTLSTKKMEADKPKITTIAILWAKERAGIYGAFEKLVSDLDKIDAIFQKNLHDQVEAFLKLKKDEKASYLKNVKGLEKTLEKVAKKLKTAAIKEIRDVFVVFRAWLEKRPIFEDDWLNPPATEAELQTLQDSVLEPLPLSFVESYRICNGINQRGAQETCYMNGGDLLFSSIAGITSECGSIKEYATNFVDDESRKEKLDEEVKNWVPVFSSNGNAWIMNLGNTLHSEFSRPITKGAIFDYNHEDGNLDEIRVVYSSFKRLIEDLSFEHEL